MDELDPYTVERTRGVLSTNERKFYAGEMEATGQKKRNIRAGARKHLQNSLLDMVLIAENMEDRDLDSVLTQNRRQKSPLDRAMSSMTSLMLYYFGSVQLLEESIANGIGHRERKDGFVSSVDVDITITNRDRLENILEILRTKGPKHVSLTDIGRLRDAGMIGEREHMRYVEQKS